jgi:hypothetical protein
MFYTPEASNSPTVPGLLEKQPRSIEQEQEHNPEVERESLAPPLQTVISA